MYFQSPKILQYKPLIKSNNTQKIHTKGNYNYEGETLMVCRICNTYLQIVQVHIYYGTQLKKYYICQMDQNIILPSPCYTKYGITEMKLEFLIKTLTNITNSCTNTTNDDEMIMMTKTMIVIST